MNKAICLLSGGLDSTVTLAKALDEGLDCHVLTFSYGQRHNVELRSAMAVANYYDIQKHMVIDIKFPWKGSALTDSNIPVPKDSLDPSVIPTTYVPMRNSILLSYAASWGEAIDARLIYAGMNVLDYSNYPDCRPEYLEQMAKALSLGSKKWFTIRTPLIGLTKAQIIQLGTDLKAPLHLTHSCYDPIGLLACGHCDSCLLRKKGFVEAGIKDPTIYS